MTLLTTEEYYARPELESGTEELLAGELLVSPAASNRHRELARRIEKILGEALGKDGYMTIAEAGVYLAKTPNPRDGRPSEATPDVMVLRKSDWLAATRRESTQRLAYRPLLAIEILSPGNTEAEIMRKAHAYLREGCYEVWIVDDTARSVRLIYPNHSAEEIWEDGDISTPHPLPQVVISLAEVFI